MTIEKTNTIIEYGNKKYAQPIGIVLLAKTLSVISLHNTNGLQPISILAIAPSGHFKSRTSKEIEALFPKKTVDLGSDVTMNNLIRAEEAKRIHKRTMLINDLTLLMSTKRITTKNRLCNGLAELLSDGRYVYRNFDSTILLEARTNLITNVTDTSYISNRREQFISNTFIERLLPLFYRVSIEDQKAFNTTEEAKKRMKMRLKLSIKIRSFKVIIPQEYDADIDVLSTKLMRNVEGQSYNRANDKIKGLLISNAYLNGRKAVTRDDLSIVASIVDLSLNRYTTKHQIDVLYRAHVKPAVIASEIGISRQAVYKYINGGNYDETG